jgi:hypothetical protein
MDGHQDPRMMASEVVILVDGLRGPQRREKKDSQKDGRVDGRSWIDVNKIESTKRGRRMLFSHPKRVASCSTGETGACA